MISVGVVMSGGSGAEGVAAARGGGAAPAPAAGATTPWPRSASIARTGVTGLAAEDSPGK